MGIGQVKRDESSINCDLQRSGWFLKRSSMIAWYIRYSVWENPPSFFSIFFLNPSSMYYSLVHCLWYHDHAPTVPSLSDAWHSWKGVSDQWNLSSAICNALHLYNQSEASIQVTWCVPTNQRPGVGRLVWSKFYYTRNILTQAQAGHFFRFMIWHFSEQQAKGFIKKPSKGHSVNRQQ